MTYIKTETIITRSSGQGSHTKRLIILKCDTCSAEFNVRYCKSQLERTSHYCSKYCAHEQRKKGGKIHEIVVQHSREKYGTDSPMQHESVKLKLEEASIKRFGVKCAFQAPSVIEKCKAAHREKWGTDSHMQSAEFMETFEQRVFEKHGVQNVFQLESVKEKSRQTNIEKRGVEYPTQSPDVVALRATNYTEQHGVDNPMKLASVKEKQIATMLERHGVVNAYLTTKARANMRDPAAQERRLRSLIEKGRQMKSLEEDDVIEAIISSGVALLRDVFVNHWYMDGCTSEGHIWIQCDGVYWHALDRDIDVINRSNGAQDRAIMRKYRRDRAQEAWFASTEKNTTGARLIRIITGKNVYDARFFDANIMNVERFWWPRDRDKVIASLNVV